MEQNLIWFCSLLNNEYCEVDIDTRKTIVVVKLTIVGENDVFLVSRKRTFESCVYDLWEQYKVIRLDKKSS